MIQKRHSNRQPLAVGLSPRHALVQGRALATALAIGAALSCAAATLSTEPAMEAAPQAVAVRMTGFVPRPETRAEDGTIPMRWHESKSTFLDDRADWLDLWHQHDLTDGTLPDGSADPGLRMHSDARPDAPVFVRTCAAWAKARADGRYAMRTLDMSYERRFIHACGLLNARACARPARMSGFLDFDLAAASRVLLPSAPRQGDSESSSESAERWTIEGNTLWHSDESFFRSIEPVFFADLDGDGWEDMFALSTGGAVQGTMRASSVRAYTRIENGPLIDITCRIPDAEPPARAPQESRAWPAFHRIAPNLDVTLHGACDTGRGRYPLTMTFAIDHRGLLTGSLQCGRLNKKLRLIGALADRQGSACCVTADDIATEEISFDWSYADGYFSIQGSRLVAGGVESWSFNASGPALSTEQRMKQDGWATEVAFEVAGSKLRLRLQCNTIGHRGTTDVLCLESNGLLRELVRFDRLEWAAANRNPEDDPASDAEMRAGIAGSVCRVQGGHEMLLLDGWMFGASTNNPYVIAIPIRAGRLAVSELQIFAMASVEMKDAEARILVHDLRAGADPYRDEPQRDPVVWTWAGAAWTSE